MDEIFDKVQARRRGGEKIIHDNLTDTLRLKYLGATVSAVGLLGAGLVAAVGLAQGQFDLGWTVRLGFSASILSVAPITYMFSENSGLVRALELVGRTARLPKFYHDDLLKWSNYHPRIFTLLTKWGAKHPEHEITWADYHHISKAMDKIERMRDFYPPSVKDFASFEEFDTALKSAIRRKALAKRVGDIRGEGEGNTEPVREIQKTRM